VSLQRFGTLDDSRDVQRAAECEVLVVEPE
jgi:hypothetical protein